ncbi:hypothetical protein B0H14DRAFT_2652167 [Mycena olivaceomarginata]|nr:hypothetical protein B0H14DRAFT_2652167 [Mycena olivaceomarginata]
MQGGGQTRMWFMVFEVAAASPRCLERVIRLGLIGEGYGRVLFEEPCSCGTSHREYHWMRLGGSLEEIETIACECLAIIEESTIIRGPEFRKENLRPEGGVRDTQRVCSDSDGAEALVYVSVFLDRDLVSSPMQYTVGKLAVAYVVD